MVPSVPCNTSPAVQPPDEGGHVEEGEGEAGGEQAVEEPRPPQRGRSVALEAGAHKHHSENGESGR